MRCMSAWYQRLTLGKLPLLKVFGPYAMSDVCLQYTPKGTFAYPNDRGRPRKDGSASAPFFHATLADAGIDKHLADRARKLAKMPEAIFAAASRRSFSFDRRDQFSASAIQRPRLAGSCFASCLHSAARQLSSD
jgi:hypothetical protein